MRVGEGGASAKDPKRAADFGALAEAGPVPAPNSGGTKTVAGKGKKRKQGQADRAAPAGHTIQLLPVK